MKHWKALKWAIHFLAALSESDNLLDDYIEDEGISYEQYDNMLVSLREQYVRATYPNTVMIDSEEHHVVVRDHHKILIVNGPTAAKNVADAWYNAAIWVDEHPPE